MNANNKSIDALFILIQHDPKFYPDIWQTQFLCKAMRNEESFMNIVQKMPKFTAKYVSYILINIIALEFSQKYRRNFRKEEVIVVDNREYINFILDYSKCQIEYIWEFEAFIINEKDDINLIRKLFNRFSKEGIDRLFLAAAMNNNLKIIRELIACGVNVISKVGYQSLEVARNNNFQELIQELTSHGDNKYHFSYGIWRS